MARVIQDSDDEEEVLIEPGILNPDVAPKAYEAVVTRVDVEVHALVVDQQPQQTPLVRGTSSSGKHDPSVRNSGCIRNADICMNRHRKAASRN